MNIIVCIKMIQDPEIPPAKFKINEHSFEVIPPEGIPPVINPYDEQAVELSLRLKERHGGRVTVLSAGEKSSLKAIKHALAMGADEGVLLCDEAFKVSDSYALAYILSLAVKKIASFDLVMCGRQAADWDEGLVGSFLAAELGMPLVTLAYEVSPADGKLTIKRATLDGYQIFSVALPAVITVSNEVGKTRLPSGWGIIDASSKEVPVWSAEDIEADSSLIKSRASSRKLVKLFLPELKRKGEILEGKNVDEACSLLAEKLRDSGVI